MPVTLYAQPQTTEPKMKVEPLEEQGAFEKAGVGEAPAFWFTDIGNFLLGTCGSFNRRTRVTGFMHRDTNDWSMNVEVLPDLTVDLKALPLREGVMPVVEITFTGDEDKVQTFLERFTKRLRRVPSGIKDRERFEEATGVDPDEADAAWEDWLGEEG